MRDEDDEQAEPTEEIQSHVTGAADDRMSRVRHNRRLQRRMG
jgi:hypothetical protein